MFSKEFQFFWFIGLMTIIFLSLIIFFVMILVKNGRVRQQAEIDVKDAIITTQEDEQNRIAEDIHDDIGPMLSAIKLQVANLSELEPDEIAESIDQIEDHLNMVINNVRGVARNLSSQIITKYGLEQSLIENINLVSTLKKLMIDFKYDVKNIELNDDYQINIYRIVRELLTNSVKHSNCTLINISIKNINDFLIVKYSDNGNKIDQLDTGKSMGQTNIKNRINLLKGKIILFSEKFDEGANYEFHFPIS